MRDDYDFLFLMVGASVGGWGGWNAVWAWWDSDGGVGDRWGGVGDGSVTAGESTVTTAGVTTAGVTTVTTAGVATAGVTTVSAAGVSGVTTSVTAGVTFLSLVVLGYLETLLNVVQLDTDDPVVGDTVHWGRGSIVRGDSVTVSVTWRRALVGLVLDFVLQDDVLYFLQ